MSNFIFFLVLLSMLYPSTQTFFHEKDDHNCDHFLRFPTNGFLVFKVSWKGCGDFTKVQEAIDAIPPSNVQVKKLILVDYGVYRERVIVPPNKMNIVMQGMGYLSTSIEWNNTAASSNGTFDSYSVGIFADSFTALNISFKNNAPAPNPGAKDEQGLALRVVGDKVAFFGCGFYGNQDTLLDQQGRHFYKECFIEGSIDFIFGNARSLYKDCTIHSVAKANTLGCITANGKESSTDQTGFAFVNCVIKGNSKVWLGRAWRPYSTVVFSMSYMSPVVSGDGWNDMGFPTSQRTVYYGEHRCYGPGANHSQRVPYAKQLTDAEAAPFTSIKFIDGDQWL